MHSLINLEHLTLLCLDCASDQKLYYHLHVDNPDDHMPHNYNHSSSHFSVWFLYILASGFYTGNLPQIGCQASNYYARIFFLIDLRFAPWKEVSFEEVP